MSSEVELKLAPKRSQKERQIRKLSKLALAIRQCYIAAHGKHAPECIRIRRIGDNHYLELIDPNEKKKKKGKRKRFWRSKLTEEAWKRIKGGSETLRVRRSKVIKGKGLGEVFFALTIKEESDLKRHEWERPIPRWAYRLLWEFGTRSGAERWPVRKRRYYVKENGRVFHVDFFLRRLEGLQIIEVEFKRTRGAKKFRRRFGKKHKKRIEYPTRPKFVRGRCCDVTARQSAGCRILSTRDKAPSFW